MKKLPAGEVEMFCHIPLEEMYKLEEALNEDNIGVAKKLVWSFINKI
jgi:hypothetical protein